MSTDDRQTAGPLGGLQVQAKTVRRWRWSDGQGLFSAPVRCKQEQWYLSRGFPANGSAPASASVRLIFLRDGEPVEQRCVMLDAVAGAAPGEALLGWVQSPEGATHLRLGLTEQADSERFTQVILHPAAECDPKCHPLANVPRWSTYQPPFPLQRVVLPASLARLAGLLDGMEVEVVKTLRSKRKLVARAIGAACVIDPAWIRDLNLTLADVERISAGSWLILDLESFATLLNDWAGKPITKIVTLASEHEVMSARVEYADVPTRGFALQDVFPYSNLSSETQFQTRVLAASAAWKKYADALGFAPLLTSETPWEKKCGDVLSAARPIDAGELIVTDLPWLAAGLHGRLLAPRLVEHMFRMHMGCPLPDSVQYWRRWDQSHVVLRDIGEMPKRYPPLRAVRWAGDDEGGARLGLSLPAAKSGGRQRHLMFRTGRFDQSGERPGLPPEPFEIFMKWLVREMRERTRWAARCLDRTAVTWQFDAGEGLKYSMQFESASNLAKVDPDATLLIEATDGDRIERRTSQTGKSAAVWRMPAGAGVLGERSLELQGELSRYLRNWIERMSARNQN